MSDTAWKPAFVTDIIETEDKVTFVVYDGGNIIKKGEASTFKKALDYIFMFKEAYLEGEVQTL